MGKHTIKRIFRILVIKIVEDQLMKKYKISALCLLLLCCASYAAQTTPLTTDIANGKSLLNDTKPGFDDTFLTPGYAEVRGRIEDYNPEAAPKNFLVYYQDNLIGAMEPISVQVADDGSFITWIPLTTPGYARFVGDNRYFDFFLAPENTLEVSFRWSDVVEYCKKQRNREPISESPFHFGKDLSRVNKELAEYPEVVSYGVYQMAHDLTPSEAIKQLTEDYEKHMIAIAEYTDGKTLDSTTEKLLKANVKSKYLFDVFEYARTREGLLRTDTLAPSLKEPLDLQYFEPIKALIAEEDKWILASRQFGGVPNMMAHSSFAELLGLEDHYLFDFGVNAFPYLKSLGATLTPEEEETNEWLGDGGLKSCTLSELYKGMDSARKAAERNGFSEQLNEFLQLQTDAAKQTGSKTLLGDAARNVSDLSEALKTYLEVDTLPLLWQIALSEALRSKYMLNADNYKDKEDLYAVFENIKNKDEISNPAVLEALENFYRRSYARKSFDIPDDHRGKVIKEMIAPYSGKILLLDFWGHVLWTMPTCHTDLR